VTGDYLAPQFNFQPRDQKPPLVYWAVLISYKIFGVNEFAVRVPGAAAAIGILLFCYGAAFKLFGARAALIAAAVVSTTPRVFILARRLPIDILLLFFLTGTLFFLIRALQNKNFLSWVPVYVFTSLGFLTKGPVAVIIPAASCLIWILWSRRMRVSETHLLPGILIFMAISLPWYLLIFRAHGWTYISSFFLRDNFGRFAAETLGPSRGPFYYITVYLTDFFPWSLLALFAAIRLWTLRRREQPITGYSYGLPLIWCALVFILFSLSKNKQEYYIAPMYPAAAIILAGALHRSLQDRAVLAAGRNEKSASPATGPEPGTMRQGGVWRWFYGLPALLLLLLSLILPYILGSFMPHISVVLHRGIIRGRPDHCFAALSFPLWVIFLMGAAFYVPALEAFRPIKVFCRTIDAHSGPGDEAGYFRTALPSMVYYLRRPIFQESSYRQMQRRFQSDRKVFCVLTEKDYAHFEKNGLKLFILDRHSRFTVKFGALFNSGYALGEELLLVSNRPNLEYQTGEGGAAL
jgi:hypothetical protein